MIQLSAADLFPKDTNDLGRKAKALSLLTAINLAFKGSGARGCSITEATLHDSSDGQSRILTLTAVPGESPATLDDVRKFFKRGSV